MWLRRCLSGAFALLLFVAVANAREWTDSTGKYKYEAEFIELRDGHVKLRLKNGTIKSAPLEKLRQADQEFARQSAAEKKKTARPSDATKVDATRQPAKAQPPKDALASDIEKSAVAYSQGATDDLARLARDWKCDLWKQKLGQARAASSDRQTADVARVEEEAAKALYEIIGKEIAECDEEEMAQYFYLPKVIRDKKAQCLGYSQLFNILGNSIGLKVRVIQVMELVSGLLPPGEGHVACLVSLSDGKAMMVDIPHKHLSRPFVFEETFVEVGNYWERKQTINSSEIHRRIQILNASGLVGCIYTGRGVGYSRSGQDSKAISDYTKAIELNPKDVKAYYNRGGDYRDIGQSTKAIADFSKAIYLDPKFAEAYQARGAAHGLLRKKNEAKSDLQKAVALNPALSSTFALF